MSLADLCAEFNVPRTSLFAILKGLERDGYVTFVEAESALRFSVKAGAVKPLSASASGHAVLAHLPAPERNAYLKSGPFQRFTPGTVTTASELRKAIARVRREHCAMTINGVDAISRILGYTAPYPPPPP